MQEYFHLFDGRPRHELMPGFTARIIHTGNMTIALWEIKKGAVLPRHQHIHEQVTHVLSGEFQMEVGPQSAVCKSGSTTMIPPNIPHQGQALSDCLLLDIFVPEREDFPRD